MKNKSVLTNVILIISALGLGFLVFKESGINLLGNSQEEKQPTTNTEGVEVPSPENNILIFPSDEASQEVKDKHFALVLEQAKDTETVVITDCKPEPLVARVKEKSQLKITNNDEKDHTLKVVAKNEPYQLKAKESMNIEVDFGRGQGVYRYTCDSELTTAGIFFVVEAQ